MNRRQAKKILSVVVDPYLPYHLSAGYRLSTWTEAWRVWRRALKNGYRHRHHISQKHRKKHDFYREKYAAFNAALWADVDATWDERHKMIEAECARQLEIWHAERRR